MCSRRNLSKTTVYIFILITIKLIIQLTLYLKGFISVSADEFSRGIRAAKWALIPKVDIAKDFNEIWLPFEKYLNGLVLRIIPDVYWAPRITVMIASCILLIAFFFIVYLIFEDLKVSFVSALWIVCHPWYAWLSGTPMLEMYYLSFLFVGLVFLFYWLKTLNNSLLFWAGVSFLFASGFHVQSWVYINSIIILTVAFYIHRNKLNTLTLGWLTGFLFLSNLFILSYEIFELITKGSLFAFLQGHTNYSKIFYGGYNVSLLDKLLYYPFLIIQNISPVSWILIITALFLLWRQAELKFRWFPFSLCVVTLIINSIMNVFSVPATAAPGRYSIFFVLQLAPYISYTVVLPIANPSGITKYYRVIGTILFLLAILGSTNKIYEFPNGMSNDAIQVGKFIKSRLDSITSDKIGYMVELKYWDFLGIELMAQHYDKRYYDREYDVYNRNTPSIFLQEQEVICRTLSNHYIRIVALFNEELRIKANTLKCLRKVKTIGDWAIYQYVPDS